MRKIIATAFAATAILAAVPAFASPHCDVSASDRLSPEQIRSKAENLGYSVRKVEFDDDGCYEAYAKNAKGERVEVYMHPATGEVLEVELDD